MLQLIAIYNTQQIEEIAEKIEKLASLIDRE